MKSGDLLLQTAVMHISCKKAPKNNYGVSRNVDVTQQLQATYFVLRSIKKKKLELPAFPAWGILQRKIS
jgi:hypothetical protein